MTGNEIFNRVCFLLGYYDFLKENDNIKRLAFCQILNQIAEELHLGKLSSLNDKFELNDKTNDALIYGSAMLFALSLKDANTAKVYSTLYSVKRSAALNTSEKREDALPFPIDGGA